MIYAHMRCRCLFADDTLATLLFVHTGVVRQADAVLGSVLLIPLAVITRSVILGRARALPVLRQVFLYPALSAGFHNKKGAEAP